MFKNKQHLLELSQFHFPRRFGRRFGHLFQGNELKKDDRRAVETSGKLNNNNNDNTVYFKGHELQTFESLRNSFTI